MATIDTLSDQVMKKVRRIETERLIVGMAICAVTLAGILVALYISFGLLFYMLNEFGSWELLKIGEYGWPSVGIFWQELPKTELAAGLVALAVGIIVGIRLWQALPPLFNRLKFLFGKK
jgi:hypothetical protein